MKDKILRLIKLKVAIALLEDNDKEKWDMLKDNLYAISEGFESRNMKQIKELEAEIESIEI